MHGIGTIFRGRDNKFAIGSSSSALKCVVGGVARRQFR